MPDMQTRRLGNSGLEVSEIGYGSWLTLGSSVDQSLSIRLVERAFDLGINFFDTADVYARGEAEQHLGRAIANLTRHHLVIATKCFFPMSERPNDRGLSRKHLFESVDASLTRLGSDYIDLHQCHRPDPDTPMSETVRAYEDLIRMGMVLYWGVSEWSAEEIAQACEIADATGGYRPISNQPNYSIMRRGIEAEVLPTSEELGLGQIVFSPLGQGVLTGKYCGGSRPEASRAVDPVHGRFMQAYLEDTALAKVSQLMPLADSIGISLAELALSWCLRHPGVSSLIVGATRPEHLDQNCRASGIALPDTICKQIDQLFPA
jgi:aryl-alcohol dehydrogenase-like predicted oxidoreductase